MFNGINELNQSCTNCSNSSICKYYGELDKKIKENKNDFTSPIKIKITCNGYVCSNIRKR